MNEISGIIADYNANIHDIRHDRSVDDLDVGEAYLVFNVETSGAEHAESIMRAIQDAGYPVENIAKTI
jgi:threonine dehydratase